MVHRAGDRRNPCKLNKRHDPDHSDHGAAVFLRSASFTAYQCVDPVGGIPLLLRRISCLRALAGLLSARQADYRPGVSAGPLYSVCGKSGLLTAVCLTVYLQRLCSLLGGRRIRRVSAVSLSAGFHKVENPLACSNLCPVAGGAAARHPLAL